MKKRNVIMHPAIQIITENIRYISASHGVAYIKIIYTPYCTVM